MLFCSLLLSQFMASDVVDDLGEVGQEDTEDTEEGLGLAIQEEESPR